MGDSSPQRIRISLKSQYALRAIFDLALHGAVRPVKIAGIAKRQRVPQKFLELILAGLRQGGFVESRRGAEGGYLLAISPETITVGDVIGYIEGGQDAKPRGRRHDDPLAAMWKRVDEAFSAVVDKITFAELIRDWEEQQKKYTPNWDI